MLKVGLISLGCAKNLVDSENILGLLKHDGYVITSSTKEADVIIVNTCGFIDSSKRESINTIFEMLSYNKKEEKPFLDYPELEFKRDKMGKQFKEMFDNIEKKQLTQPKAKEIKKSNKKEKGTSLERKDATEGF